MRVGGQRRLQQKMGGALLALGVLAALSGVSASAENLDQGKSGARLFAESCVTCHRSPRGLAKGRFSLTLYMFLQQHYVSTASAAKELTAYLQAADSAAPDRRSVAAKRAAGAASGSSPRPPAAVTGH
jgi:mono/diheme cytochrome c family protein